MLESTLIIISSDQTKHTNIKHSKSVILIFFCVNKKFTKSIKMFKFYPKMTSTLCIEILEKSS